MNKEKLLKRMKRSAKYHKKQYREHERDFNYGYYNALNNLIELIENGDFDE